jgi:hypothetical protein
MQRTRSQRGIRHAAALTVRLAFVRRHWNLRAVWRTRSSPAERRPPLYSRPTTRGRSFHSPCRRPRVPRLRTLGLEAGEHRNESSIRIANPLETAATASRITRHALLSLAACVALVTAAPAHPRHRHVGNHRPTECLSRPADGCVGRDAAQVVANGVRQLQLQGLHERMKDSREMGWGRVSCRP